MNMSKNEDKMSMLAQKALYNLVTTVLLVGCFLIYSFGTQDNMTVSINPEIQFWGSFTLKMIGVMVIAKIILHIIFAIFQTIKAGHKIENELEFMDERDRLIEMKSDRYSHWVFVVGFVAAMIPISMGYSVQYMFLTLFVFGLASAITNDVWKIYLYNTGV